MTARNRFRGAVMAAICLVALAVSAALHPSGSGFGTHRQVGLPQCEMITATGWPCPACGMTTSMTQMAHGRLAVAFAAHPFGVVLFAAACILAVAGLVQAVSGRVLPAVLQPRLMWIAVGLGGLLAGWAWRVYTGVAAGQLPIRY